MNALAILIFLAQIPDLILEEEASFADRLNPTNWDNKFLMNLAFVGLGLTIIYGLPRLTKAVPSPLVAIVFLTIVATQVDLGLSLPTVGDKGELPSALPSLSLPGVPKTLETLKIILPYSITLTFVGLLESLLTAQVLDDLNDDDSDKNRESRGQGIANVATGFLGGMAGCAMIGQSMINHRSGGRTRLSTLSAGVFLLILIMALGDLVAQIPMAALVAVMIMVAVGTFDWSSLAREHIKLMPQPELIVMAATVGVVVFTHNLAYGVGVGVLLSAIFFVRHVTHVVKVSSVVDPDNTERLYSVTGELFFASSNDLVHAFDYDSVKVKRVEIDLSDARIWEHLSGRRPRRSGCEVRSARHHGPPRRPQSSRREAPQRHQRQDRRRSLTTGARLAGLVKLLVEAPPKA